MIIIIALLFTFFAFFSTFGNLSQTVISPSFLNSAHAQENIDLNGTWERDDKGQINITQTGSEVFATSTSPQDCSEGDMRGIDPYFDFKGTIDGNQIIGEEAGWCYYGGSNPDENGLFITPFRVTISDDGNQLTLTSPDRFTKGAVASRSYSKISGPGDAGVSPSGGCTTWTNVIAKIEGPNTVKAGQDVTLDASKSYSESGMDCYDSSTRSRTADVSYFWEQIEGPKIDAIDLNSAIIKFKAPLVDSKTKLMLLLTVTSGRSNDQIPKNITVQPSLPTAVPYPPNEPIQPSLSTNVTYPPNEPIQPSLSTNVTYPPNEPIQPSLSTNVTYPPNEPIQPSLPTDALPLWLIVIAVIAVVVTPVTLYLARRHNHTDVPPVLQDRVNQRIPKNTIDIITEGGIE